MASDVAAGRSRVSLTAELPSELLQPFLQHVRDYESRHFDDVHLVIAVDSPNLAVEEIERMLSSIKPPFSMMTTVRK